MTTTITSFPGRDNVWMQYYTSLAVFLLGALALVVPSGYSIGAVLLLLGSVVLFLTRPALALNRQDWLVIIALLAYAMVIMVDAWLSGLGTRGFDRPARFLFALPALLLVMAYPPRLGFLWSGLAVGAIATGIWTGWQKLVMGVGQAEGYTLIIQFGNLSLLMGMLCLAGLGWASVQARRHGWYVLLLLGAVGGTLGSLFSGTRGGWVALPLAFCLFLYVYRKELSGFLKLLILASVIGGGVLAYLLPQTGVEQRVQRAMNDIQLYQSEENPATSVGARFDMWKGASLLIAERPIFGWGEVGYREAMPHLGELGIIHPSNATYGHAHNEYLDMWAKRGVIGLLSLLAVYFVPLILFGRHLNHKNLEFRSVALAGVLFPVSFMAFGLTQVFFSHNSGVMMYAFWLAVLWGITSRMNKQANGEPHLASDK